jgi:predicted metalloprotease with PDZ domain
LISSTTQYRERPGSYSSIAARDVLACLVLLSAIFWLSGLAAQEPALARHEVSFPQRQNQYVNVTATWPVDGPSVELAMPSWTPGSYLIRDFAGQVEDLRARGPDGRPLNVRKASKNHWRIETTGVKELTVSYRVWAGELSVATSWVESGQALLNGAGVFLYSEQSRSWPQQVRVRLPADWAGVFTALPESAEAGVFVARDYDELVDSPIVAGNMQSYDFKVRGWPYALVSSGTAPLWDGEQARKDVAAIVEAQQEFWGVNPFEREYVFLNFFMGPYSGLEHDHSTVIMSDVWLLASRSEYIKWLGVVSHEFFHAWNVRRMRPEALVDYDYDAEVYTRELWLAEGLSSYYDDLLLFRAGLIDVSDYFDLLAQVIRNYEAMPGRQVRSAERASFDAWIKHYKPDGNSVNSTVSYYLKGAVIGFVTDTAIRRETNNRSSLDTVLRRMYERYGPDGPGQGAYPPGAFEAVVEDVAGPEVRGFVETLLRATDDPEVDRALAWYGLRLDRTPERAQAKNDEPPPGGLGVLWQVDGNRLVAEQVLLGHSGANAGVIPGDELLAIDGIRVTPEDHAVRIQQLPPGRTVELTLARHERLFTLPVEVQQAILDTYAIATKPNMSRREKKRLQAWLGRDLRFLD